MSISDLKRQFISDLFLDQKVQRMFTVHEILYEVQRMFTVHEILYEVQW